MNFESQLLLMYFAKLIFVLGLGDGFDSSRAAASNVLSDLFGFLDQTISGQPKGVAWKDLPIGFLRGKRHRYRSVVNALFLALDLRLQKAMLEVGSDIRSRERTKLPKKALDIIQRYAVNDAKIILKTLGKKKNRLRKLKAILQLIIKPLAKNIFIPSENVPQYRQIPQMTLRQLIVLRTHLAETKSALDNLGQAIHYRSKPGSKPQAARNKMPLHLSYDPKTQRGMVLRLRAQLGHVFQLRFQAIGANGSSIYHLPAEILFNIVGLLVKVNPTRQDTKTLFAAATSTFVIRQVIEDPGFEHMISRRVLGIHHSRTREERRLGLEPNVAKRYKGVLRGLRYGTNDVISLQLLANRNAEIYKAKGSAAYYPFIAFRSDEELETKKELEEEEESSSSSSSPPPPQKRVKLSDKYNRISVWPWWYFRLLSNYLSLQSMTRRFGSQTDAFSASVVSFSVLEERGIVRHTDAKRGTPVAVNRGAGFLIHLARKPDTPVGALWSRWSSGADLMVIPMQRLLHRAWKYTTDSFKDGREIDGPTRLTISVAESMPLKGPARPGKASYRKEVVILTSLNQKEMPESLVFHYKQAKSMSDIFKKKKLTLDLRLRLEIQHAYLGTSLIQFLNHSLQPRPYLQVQELSLQHVHFPNPASSLDLSGIAKDLHDLRFGPSNLIQVPKLVCPSSTLFRLWLVAAPKTLLRWDLLAGINPATCFLSLNTLFIDGDVRIWESPLVEKIGKFPSLFSIILNHFPGNDEDLRRLAKSLENIRGLGAINVMVNLDYVSNVIAAGVVGNVVFSEFDTITESRFDPEPGSPQQIYF